MEPNGDPWVFVCASIMIEYLQKMVGSSLYSDFVNKWLSRINPIYRDFKYINAETKLAEQMFFVLRNGLVHSFTLKPNRAEGKINSILLSHKDPHLIAFNQNGFDSCILNAKEFLDDLVKVIDLIFSQAETDDKLKESINSFFKENPPIGKI